MSSISCIPWQKQDELIQITPMHPVQRDSIANLRDIIRPLCKKGNDGIAVRDTIEGEPEGHDAMMYAGLLCLSGEEDQCNRVTESQTFEGRMWRSPNRARTRDFGGDFSFSRDMGLGVLAYLVKRRDGNLATHWRNYIWSTERKFPLQIKAGNLGLQTNYWLCTEYPTLENPDERCNMTPEMMTNFNAVWKYLFGSDDPFLSRNSRGETDYWDEAIIFLQNTPPSFNLHLQAITLLLWKEIDTYKYRDHGLLYRTIKDRQPENPFYQYLGGNHNLAAQIVINQLLAVLSRGVHQIPGTEFVTNHYRYEWSFQRDTKTHAWTNTMFWEYLFLINMLIRDYDKNYL